MEFYAHATWKDCADRTLMKDHASSSRVATDLQLRRLMLNSSSSSSKGVHGCGEGVVDISRSWWW